MNGACSPRLCSDMEYLLFLLIPCDELMPSGQFILVGILRDFDVKFLWSATGQVMLLMNMKLF